MWPLKATDHFGIVEVVADEAKAAFGMEVRAIEGGDAGGLLAAMLQGVQAERGQRGGIRMPNTPKTPHSSRRRVVASRATVERCRARTVVLATPWRPLRFAQPTRTAAVGLRYRDRGAPSI